MTLIHSWCSISFNLCCYKDTFLGVFQLQLYNRKSKFYSNILQWWILEVINFVIIHLAGAWRRIMLIVVVKSGLYHFQFLVQMAFNEFCDWLYPGFIFAAITLISKSPFVAKYAIFFSYTFHSQLVQLMQLDVNNEKLELHCNKNKT